MSIQHVTDTALWVAIHRGREGLRPDALFKDPLAFRLAGERGQQIAQRMSGESFMSWMMAMRTVGIDRLIEEGIADGVTRIVNLGAGLDTRPYRMTLPDGITWIEVDFPGMIEHKTKILLDEKPGVPLQRYSLDLSQRTKAQEFFKFLGNNNETTLVITEGVIPYLSPEDVANLADDLHAIPNLKYWIHDYREGGYAAGIPKLWLKWRMRYAPFKFDVKNWFGFFSEHGWRLKHKISLNEESLRRNRSLDSPGWIGMLSFLIPKKRIKNYTNSIGVAIFERG